MTARELILRFAGAGDRSSKARFKGHGPRPGSVRVARISALAPLANQLIDPLAKLCGQRPFSS